ncbi:MAG: M3 family oligoendopeptidase [Pirellulales bacterium]|nr:M3 family oligoendopeptidase [Pirellulales bacterium]
MPTAETPPDDKPTRWNLANIYPSLASPEFQADVARLGQDLAACEAFFDQGQVRRRELAPAESPITLADVLESALQRTSALVLLSSTLESFVYGVLTTDSYDVQAQRELSRLEALNTRMRTLLVRLQGWIGSLEARLTELIAGRELLARHGFFLRRAAEQSRYLMSEPLEELAAELCVDGPVAFGKLQGNLTSQIKVQLRRGDQEETLPITAVRNLCSDPDPAVREAAYHAELAGWRSAQTAVAACLNSVKGAAINLARRRGRDSVLAAALDANLIDRPTLDALLDTIREYFPAFRRYLRSKAQKLGREKLPWWDLFAPMGASQRRFTWSQARALIVEKFAQFTPELGEFAARAFDEHWIDGETRDGKRGGAFCMEVMRVEQSRILANFDGSFDGVSTLAHELGHAYHNFCQTGLDPLLRGAPMILAETASIFCETLITEAALATAGPDEQLAILETQLTGATQVCLDISSRFLFETALLERRAASELAPEELCELMLAAQRETYADAVDEATYHPFMWLWKPHYYAYQDNFYNFPYAFGHLFATGLYAIYRREGASFLPRYGELLRDTGQDYAAPLAARFGIDIRQPDFWRGSLRLVGAQITRYESLGSG